MTTEDTPITQSAPAPMIDLSAAAQEARQKRDYDENMALIAEMEKRKAEEAKIAAEQDAALAAVRAECDAYRVALKG